MNALPNLYTNREMMPVTLPGATSRPRGTVPLETQNGKRITPEFGFCFRPAPGRDDCSGVLHLWIDHRGKTCFVPTAYDVRWDEWDAVSGTLVVGHCDDERRSRLRDYARAMDRSLRVVENVVSRFVANRRRFTAAEVARVCNKTI